ncbi:response regulator [Sphingorhabdus sp. EL138]|uniref:response regulator transcription factor n=1 Tax=Sphingorhabdus sp. EL138 TaxID=2073156 RepID=UPI000D6887EE|nr:response regulator transcription factor [Sphingorhabdus sp. EL138]
MARIIIADDHPLFRGALCQAVLKLWPQAELVEAETVASARDAVNAEPADLLLLDLHMEDSDGLTALLDFRHDFPALPVVVVSASEESRVVRACQSLGASGFIPKSVDLDVMREALAQIRDGDVWFDADVIDNDDDAILFEKLASLTPAQRRILNLVSEGMLNKQIAYQMEISEATVKAHITAIFRKLDVVNRTQAVLVAKQLDVELPEVKSV